MCHVAGIGEGAEGEDAAGREAVGHESGGGQAGLYLLEVGHGVAGLHDGEDRVSDDEVAVGVPLGPGEGGEESEKATEEWRRSA